MECRQTHKLVLTNKKNMGVGIGIVRNMSKTVRATLTQNEIS